VRPDLTVGADVDVTLDARGAREVAVRTPEPTEPLSLRQYVHRDVGGKSITIGRFAWGSVQKLFAVPSEAPKDGTLEFMNGIELEKPALTMRVAGPGLALHPAYLTPDGGKRLDGRRTLPVVYVGAGRPDDFAGRDVRGKVVLVRSTPGLAIEDQVAAAAAAKAAIVAVFGSEPGVFLPYVKPEVPLPTVGLSQAEGAELLRRLARGQVKLALEGTVVSPYRYDLSIPHQQRIPDDPSFTAGPKNTAIQDTVVSSIRPGQTVAFTTHYYRPYTAISIAFVYEKPAPVRQKRYFAANDTEYSQSVYATYPDHFMLDLGTTFTPGSRRTRSYFAGPLQSGTEGVRGPNTRVGDRLALTFDSFVDGERDNIFARQGTRTAARMYRDGELVSQYKYAIGNFDIGVEGPATYRVEQDVSEDRPGWVLSPEIYSAWTFRSARPAGTSPVPLPVLEGRWRLGLDLTNTAPAGTSFPLRLDARTQAGAPAVPVESATAWVSYDDGGTWKKVALRKGPAAKDGTVSFTGVARHPALRDTTGYVSLRYQVTDTAGGKAEQTVMRAYALR
jgi:PA domain